MGKTKNRKRAKMLRQRKKERENKEYSKPDNNRTYAISKIKKRLEKELNADVKFNYRKKTKGRKISDVVLEMIRPMMKEARTFKEKQNIVGLGVSAWNLGVIKVNNGEKEMQKALKEFETKLPKKIKEVLLDYCEIKCEKYSKYNEFIVDYEFTRLNSDQNNLIVSYKNIDE